MSIASGLLDSLFPPRCAACRATLREEEGFCDPCSQGLVPLDAASCIVCRQPQVDGYCAACRERRPAFDRVCVGYLASGTLLEAIHRFKYGDAPQAVHGLAALVWPIVRDEVAWADALVPMTLHPARLRQRGYDQSLLLAKAWARRGKRPALASALARRRATLPQVGQGRQERLENLEGAFSARAEHVHGRKLLLVDDVLTTGATANAAAQALKNAGAVEVRVVALARAP